METHTLAATLKGFGAQPTAAAVVVERLTPGRRAARAGAMVGYGLIAALIALPIPVVHFMLVPGSLLVGGLMGAIRLAQREIFRSAEGPCPFCGTRQKLALAGKSFRLPLRLHCNHCGRELDLQQD
jgi:hypothetical protein